MTQTAPRKTTSRVALAQTNASEDFQANVNQALEMVPEAAREGADLLAFPEVFLFIGNREGRLRVAEPLDGPTVSRFREAAAKHGILILLGSIHERIEGRDDKIHNTSVLIGRDGELIGHYRKINMFDLELPNLTFKESDTIQRGDVPPPVLETDIGRVGLSICFDMRFPDLYQHLRRAGAEIIFIPANFTAHTGAAHWEVMLRARAVETQCWVGAPAQWGRHSSKQAVYGHSALVDPWGHVTALAPEKTGLTYGTVDLDYLRKVRRELPMGFPE